MAGRQPKQEETETERALGRIGSERYARFVEKFLPLEKEFLADVADQREERRSQRGMASNDMAVASSGVRQAAATPAVQSGNALGLANTSTDLGASNARNTAALEDELDKQYVGDMQGLVARGSGQAGAALSGLSSAAQAASQRAAEDARMALANRQATQQAIGTGLGIGGGLMFGTEGGRNMLKNIGGAALGSGTKALGLMSPTGQYSGPADPGLQTFPY